MHEALTVITEIFVRQKLSYSGVRELSYAINFRSARAVSHTFVYMHGFRMLLNFVLSAKSMKYIQNYIAHENFCHSVMVMRAGVRHEEDLAARSLFKVGTETH